MAPQENLGLGASGREAERHSYCVALCQSVPISLWILAAGVDRSLSWKGRVNNAWKQPYEDIRRDSFSLRNEFRSLQPETSGISF